MAHLPPVGGDHIGCGRQASRATELCHHFTPGETLLRTTRIFCISQRTFQVFTDFNRFVQRPAPLGSRVIRACGKRCASATIDSASSSPASTPPFSLKSLKPYFSYAASASAPPHPASSLLRDAGDTSHIYHPAGFDTAAVWLCDYRRRTDNRAFRLRYAVDHRPAAMPR